MVEPLGSKAALTPEARRAKPQGRQIGKWDARGTQEQRLRQVRAEAWDIALVLKGETP